LLELGEAQNDGRFPRKTWIRDVLDNSVFAQRHTIEKSQSTDADVERGPGKLPREQKPLRVGTMFESCDNVIRVPDDDDVGGVMFASSGDATAPCGVPTSVFAHSPSSETPALSHFRMRRSTLSICDAMLDELDHPFV
jgi:hypothetical protein